jgi:hypothetical protein
MDLGNGLGVVWDLGNISNIGNENIGFERVVF